MPSFAGVVEAVAPGVVAVRARFDGAAAASVKSSPAGSATAGPVAEAAADAEAGRRRGSGFVVHRDGLVVTSRHVVAGATAIEVRLPGGVVHPARIAGEDRASDLALVRLIDPPADLQALPIGDSSLLRAGDWVVAMGSPFGFAQTVTAGVVSFVGRHLPHDDLEMTNDFLQFSATVHPGSSGCPVFDAHGNVVGVTTQAASDAHGISFAVPSRVLKWSLARMQQARDGIVRRGYLGIEFATRRSVEPGAPAEGVVVLRVTEGEPAHRAGVRRGDILLRVDGVSVPDANTLHERIVTADPGTRIALQVLRGGRVQDPVEAVLGEMGGPRTLHPSN